MRFSPIRFVSAALLALVLLWTPDARAQTTRMGVHAGLNFDGNEVFIGLNGQFGITISDRQALVGLTGELYPFIDNMSVTVVELDALFPFRVSAVELYGGGGLALRMRRLDLPSDSIADDSDTDVGLNIKVGAVFGNEEAGIRPFVELDQTIGAGTDLAARAGVFFMLGGGR
jgi:hypothetical protein